MRFLADMGVDVRVARWLREQGHDAKHLRDEGLIRMEDPDIFSKALAEDRTVLAFDLEFGEIAAFSRKNRPSVILFRLANTRWMHVVDRLRSVLETCVTVLAEGAIVTVEETRHRIRLLPIGRIANP